MLSMFVLLYRPCACSRLRLASARGLLKLAKCPAYRDLIPLPTFLRLSLTVQVEGHSSIVL